MAATCVFRRSGQRSMATIRRFCRVNPMIGGCSSGDQGSYLKTPMSAVANYQPKSCCTPNFAINSWSLFGAPAAAGGRQRGFSTSSGMPLLMIPPEAKWVVCNDKHNDEKDKSYHHFYDVRSKIVTRARKRQIPGLPDDTPWSGSCHCWVIFMNKTNGVPYLVNPFHDYDPCPVKSNLSDYDRVFPHYVQLPPLYSLRLHHSPMIYIKKLAMSAAPYDDDCKIVAVIGPSGRLAYCRPRDKKWTLLEVLQKDDDDDCTYRYNDIIYSSQDQLFYAIGGESTDNYYFESWDLLNDHPQGTLIRPSLVCRFVLNQMKVEDVQHCLDWMKANSVERRYLVQWLGDLFLFTRLVFTKTGEDGNLLYPPLIEGEFYASTEEMKREQDRLFYQEYTYMTHLLLRFKLDRVQNKWDIQPDVHSLGDHSVFLGLNHSFARRLIPGHEDPNQVEGSKGDIYFSDDTLETQYTFSNLWGGHDCGVSYDPRCFLPPSLKRIHPRPIWIDNVSSHPI